MVYEYGWTRAKVMHLDPEWYAPAYTQGIPAGAKKLRHHQGQWLWVLWTGQHTGWMLLRDGLNDWANFGWELSTMAPILSEFHGSNTVSHELMCVFRRPQPIERT